MVKTLDQWQRETPRAVLNRLARNKMRCKTYAPDWRRPNERWLVLDRERVGDLVILLCRRPTEWSDHNFDYAVFTDLLAPKSCPSDKFTSRLRWGKSMFKSIVAAEKERSW